MIKKNKRKCIGKRDFKLYSMKYVGFVDDLREIELVSPYFIGFAMINKMLFDVGYQSNNDDTICFESHFIHMKKYTLEPDFQKRRFYSDDIKEEEEEIECLDLDLIIKDCSELM